MSEYMNVDYDEEIKENNENGEMSVFYKQLLKICKDNNVKPTPLIKSLGFCATNLKRWQNGATVNSDILEKLSNHFNVPVDYFFKETEQYNDKKYIEFLETVISFLVNSSCNNTPADKLSFLFALAETPKSFDKEVIERARKTFCGTDKEK